MEMKNAHRLFCLLAALLALAAQRRGVHALHLKNAIVFGDSISDTGNAHKAYPVLPNTTIFSNNRFTSTPGLNWVDVLKDSAKVHVRNFAYAAAAFCKSNALPFYMNLWPNLLFGLEDQVDAFMQSMAKTTLRTGPTAVFIWLGSNDALNLLGQNPNAPAAAVAGVISRSIDCLVANVVALLKTGKVDALYLLSPAAVELVPLVKLNTNATQQAAIGTLVDAYTAALALALKTQVPPLVAGNRKASRVPLKVINMAKVLRTAIANPPPPLVEKVRPCYLITDGSLLPAPTLGAPPCSDPNIHIFDDVVHPTVPVHKKVIAAAVLKQLRRDKLIK